MSYCFGWKGRKERRKELEREGEGERVYNIMWVERRSEGAAGGGAKERNIRGMWLLRDVLV